MSTSQDLIERGFFPSELIPAFTTYDYSRILPRVAAVTGAINYSKYCVYSIPRLRHDRRTLGIPHPLNQLQLCKVIEQNWTSIVSQMASSPISRSTVVVDSKRAVKTKCDWTDFTVHRATCSVDSRFVLKTDMSRYYSTIYTHSIPWALHTKAVAKSNTSMSLYGNQIDKQVRNCQDRQTIGIPIGPDTSLIISECIGSSIDYELAQQLTAPLKGGRFIDDYYLYFASYAEAEDALAKLRVITKQYELELNPNKTEIVSIPETLEMKWVSDLRFHTFRGGVRSQLTDIMSYFSKAFEYVKLYPDQFVLKYALSRIKALRVEAANWSIYESLILKSIMAEPSVLHVATEIFLAYNQLGYSLDIYDISAVMEETVMYHSKFNHGYELSWALWICKSLGIVLSANAVQALASVDDPFVTLVALDLQNCGLTSTTMDITGWTQYMTSGELYGDHWILAYEALRRGWLPSANNYVVTDPFFSILDANNVSFYNPSLQVIPPTLVGAVPHISYGGGGGY